jgi:uncharacterized membrane protein YdjX (TVP38/TMEM64 family)
MKFNIRTITCTIAGILIGVVIGSLLGKVYIGTIIGVTLAGALFLTFGQNKTRDTDNTDQ